MYDVILADPPWQFRAWARDESNKTSRSAHAHYSTMSIADICALDVGALAAKNCALFLWCVWPSIFEFTPPLLESWGFSYRTIAWVWVKSNKENQGFVKGMGYYTRSNSEPCLLAVKGRMPVAARDVLSIIHSPRRKHSQKPEEQYEKIERLYPGRRYLELFARSAEPRPGWAYWGNEVASDVHLPQK